jgi:hypothetical protein
MPEIVGQRRSLHDIRIDSTETAGLLRLILRKLLREAARDLRHLVSVSQPVVEYDAFTPAGDLGDVRQALQGVAVEDAVAISLPRVAVLPFVVNHVEAIEALGLGQWLASALRWLQAMIGGFPRCAPIHQVPEGTPNAQG